MAICRWGVERRWHITLNENSFLQTINLAFHCGKVPDFIWFDRMGNVLSLASVATWVHDLAGMCYYWTAQTFLSVSRSGADCAELTKLIEKNLFSPKFRAVMVNLMLHFCFKILHENNQFISVVFRHSTHIIIFHYVPCSSRLDWWAFSQPLERHCSKVIFCANNKDFWRLHDSANGSASVWIQWNAWFCYRRCLPAAFSGKSVPLKMPTLNVDKQNSKKAFGCPTFKHPETDPVCSAKIRM